MECSPCPRTVQSSSTKKWSRSCWRSWQRRNQRKVPRGWSCCEGGPPWHHHHHHHHRRPNKTCVILHLQCVSKYGVTIIVLLFCYVTDAAERKAWWWSVLSRFIQTGHGPWPLLHSHLPAPPVHQCRKPIQITRGSLSVGTTAQEWVLLSSRWNFLMPPKID